MKRPTLWHQNDFHCRVSINLKYFHLFKIENTHTKKVNQEDVFFWVSCLAGLKLLKSSIWPGGVAPLLPMIFLNLFLFGLFLALYFTVGPIYIILLQLFVLTSLHAKKSMLWRPFVSFVIYTQLKVVVSYFFHSTMFLL